MNFFQCKAKKFKPVGYWGQKSALGGCKTFFTCASATKSYANQGFLGLGCLKRKKPHGGDWSPPPGPYEVN